MNNILIIILRTSYNVNQLTLFGFHGYGYLKIPIDALQ